MKRFNTVLVWLRRDLRLHDHAALHYATQQAQRVILVFIFDRNILHNLPPNDRRVGFIHASLQALQQTLSGLGSSMIVRHGDPVEQIPALAERWSADAVFCNHDDEPYAIQRDRQVAQQLQITGRTLFDFKDQVIFERDEVLTNQGKPFQVFTPYQRAWRRRLDLHPPEHLSVDVSALAKLPVETLPDLADLGFQDTPLPAGIIPGHEGAQTAWQDFQQRLDRYANLRNFPAKKGPSYLSVHLRFGTLSIRELVGRAWTTPGEGAQTWLNELIWREFYQQLLWHYPSLAEGHSFRAEFDHMEWPNPPGHFTAWCEARTGYPLVDAAMRQLLTSGYMHNRLRMVSAAFLVKDLQVDWRMGEAWFARHLLDFDLAANNGGWQWSASTGCDAQPWFRIFNPVTQSEKFDPDGQFIRRYLPELSHLDHRCIHAPWHCGGVKGYPPPLVDHAIARAATLARYKNVKTSN